MVSHDRKARPQPSCWALHSIQAAHTLLRELLRHRSLRCCIEHVSSWLPDTFHAEGQACCEERSGPACGDTSRIRGFELVMPSHCSQREVQKLTRHD
jgi:hypothetical protein